MSNQDNAPEEEPIVELHGPTLDYVRATFAQLGTYRKGRVIRICAGLNEDHPFGLFYWGYSAAAAREFAASLCELANEIQPTRRLC